MFCTKCGKQVPDHNTFCPYCGTPLGQSGGTQGSGQPAGNTPAGKSGDDNGSLLALALSLSAAGFFVALIVVIIGAVIFLRKHPISSWNLPFFGEKAAVEETIGETMAGETDPASESEIPADPSARGSVVITVKDANIHESPLGNIQVKVFAANAYPGQVVAEGTTASDGTVLIEDLPYGRYVAEYSGGEMIADYDQFDISAENSEHQKMMVHTVDTPFAYAMLEWGEDEDLDLVFYNGSTMEYIRSFMPRDRMSNTLYADQTGTEGFELMRLQDIYAEYTQSFYVLDYDAVIGSASIPENECITFTVYSDGAVLHKTFIRGTGSENAYSIGYIRIGEFTESLQSLDITSKDWAMIVKTDENAVADYNMDQMAYRISAINTRMQQESNSIDLEMVRYNPGIRDTSYAWDSSVFTSLEDVDPEDPGDGLLYGYQIGRRRMITTATGNQMECEIYTDPDTGRIRKIITLEYCEDHMALIAYYYDATGKVNLVYTRAEINYTPMEPSLKELGEYYFFKNDCMVRCRVVQKNKITDYGLGGDAADDGVSLVTYDSLNDAQKDWYDTVELISVNSAYCLYYFMGSQESITAITGTVCDETGIAKPGAQVDLMYNDHKIYTVNADTNGSYKIYATKEEQDYELLISMPECIEIHVYEIEIEEQALEAYVDTAYLVKETSSTFDVTLDVSDSLNYNENHSGMARVGNADLFVRMGMNNRHGSVVCQLQTDENGYANANLQAGMYTVEVVKEGYDTLYLNIHVYEGITVIYLSASPKLNAGEMRVVLTWGATPYDLDSHLYTPYSGDWSERHIWYANKSNSVGDNLDVDDTNSYGPETITIPAIREGQYKYYVVDYTNSSGGHNTSTQMSNSGATVRVYTENGLVATYHVPTAQEGVIWEVFEVRNGQIIPIQRYYTYNSDMEWWNHR